MDDQEKLAKKSMYLSFREFYSHNPHLFIKTFYSDIRLNLWQKIMIKALVKKDSIVSYIQSMIAKKRYENKYRLKLMEEMKMDFEVWKSDRIEIYEKGTLAKIIKNKGE